MTTLLCILIVWTTLTFVLGFGCGWYTRGAYTKKWKKLYDDLVAHARHSGWLVTAKQILEAGIIQMPYVSLQVTEADYHPSIWQRLRHLWWRLRGYVPSSVFIEEQVVTGTIKPPKDSSSALAALTDVEVRVGEDGKSKLYFPTKEEFDANWRDVVRYEELEAQRRSFSYGNCKLDNEGITREMVDQEAEKLKAEKA